MEGDLISKWKRAKVRIPAVPYSGMLDDRTGYIYLSKFTRGSAGEVRKALMALRDSAGMEQLVLDLARKWRRIAQRECPAIVNLFVPKGTEIVFDQRQDRQVEQVVHRVGAPDGAGHAAGGPHRRTIRQRL